MLLPEITMQEIENYRCTDRDLERIKNLPKIKTGDGIWRYDKSVEFTRPHQKN